MFVSFVCEKTSWLNKISVVDKSGTCLNSVGRPPSIVKLDSVSVVIPSPSSFAKIKKT